MTKPPARMVTPADVAARLKAETRALAVTHEAPDGDALGCVSAFLQMAEHLGIDCRAYVPGTSTFPDEYLFLPKLDGVLRGTPPEVNPETTVYMLDCASLMRSNGHQMAEGATRVNIDHHQDNPAYGEINLLDPAAPSTTAILYEVFKAGEFAVDVDVATALYVGLVTDTGRFQYSNTTASAHLMAAELQDIGLDVNAVYREVYESTPLPKLMLLQKALCHLETRLGGALALSWLGSGDFADANADEGHAEGIIDILRTIQGVRVAALIKERSSSEHADCKVSLRSTDGSVNVAAMANKRGGGGHLRASGFSCDAGVASIMDWVEKEVRATL